LPHSITTNHTGDDFGVYGMSTELKPRRSDGGAKAAESDARRQTRKNIRAVGKLMNAFAVLRTKKYKTNGSISNLSSHNMRNGRQPSNADPAKANENKYWLQSGNTIDEAVNNRLDESGVTVRKNAVKMIEHVMTFSPDAIKPDQLNTWVKSNQQWAAKTYGKENVVGMQLHCDETTAHLHMQCVPIVSKRRKLRGKDEFGPEQLRLDARHFTGGAAKLSTMQTSYAEAMAKHGLERGIMKAGTHNPHHTDVRFRRGELMREKRVLDIESRIDRAVSERNEAQRKMYQAQNNCSAHKAARSTAEQEQEQLRKRLEDERKKQEQQRKEIEKLNKRLDELDPARAQAKGKMLPQLKIGGPRGGK